jgi:hypothetical protein
MNARRFIGSLLATALAATSLGVIATASPAAAATATSIVPAGSGTSWITYSNYRQQPGAPAVGDTIDFAIDVRSNDGSGDPYAGTVIVQRQLKGSSTWVTIAKSDYPFLYGSTKAVSNAYYRAVYSGGSSSTTSWTGSSATKAVAVQRKLNITPKNRPLGLVVKVAPKGKVAITVLKKQGRKWKRYRVVRTNRVGRAFVRLPAPAKRGKKAYWKLQIKPSRNFALTQSGIYYTTKY